MPAYLDRWGEAPPPPLWMASNSPIREMPLGVTENNMGFCVRPTRVRNMLFFTRHGTLNKSLNLTTAQYSHLENGCNSIS